MERSSPSGLSRHVPALDGIRGLAILAVVFHHFAAFPRYFFPGWAGVDLFFVLSGYLITGRLLSTRGKPHYFSRFYRNRILRIWPLYYLVLTAFFIILFYFISARNQPGFSFYTDHWKSFVIFTQNWSIIRYGWPRDLSLMPLWSIALEEQFYLLWPLVIFLLPAGKTRLRVFLILLLFIPLVRSAYYFFLSPSASSIYFNTFFRMDSFLAGGLLCQVHRMGINIPPTWQKIGAAFISIVLVTAIAMGSISPYKPFMTTVGYTFLAGLFTLLLHAAVQPKGFVARLCNISVLRFCGKISYCLYLVHVPISLLLGTRLYLLGISYAPGLHDFIYWASAIICLGLSFLISIFSFRYFESWFLSMKAKP